MQRAISTEDAGGVLRTFEGHTLYVRTCALSADGRTLFSGSWDKTLKQWDVASGRCERTFSGHTNWVNTCALSADGRTLFSGGADETLKQWDVASGRCERTFSGHTSWVRTCALSADGRTLFSGSEDKTLKQWDVASGRCERTFSGHTNTVYTCALSADGRTLFSGSGDKTLKQWDVASGRCERTFSGHTNWVRTCALSADGRTLFSGSSDKTLKQWDVASGRCERTFSGHISWVRTCALSADGRTLFSGSGDKTLKQWDVASGRCERTFSGHTSDVYTCALSADGRTLFSGSDDKTLKQWRLTSPLSLTAPHSASPPTVVPITPPEFTGFASRSQTPSPVNTPVPATALTPLPTTNTAPLASLLQTIEQGLYNNVTEKLAALQTTLTEHANRLSSIETEQQQLRSQQAELSTLLHHIDQAKQRVDTRIATLTQQARAGTLPAHFQTELATLKANQALLLIEYHTAQTMKQEQQRIGGHDCLLLCYNHLQYKLNAWFTGYLSLDSGMVEESTSLTVQGITVLGEAISSVPGIGMMTGAAKIAVTYREKRQREKKALSLTSIGVGSQAMNEVVERLARKMVLHYESALCQLTAQGAIHVGQWCAKPVIAWLYVVDDTTPSALQPEQLADAMLGVIRRGGIDPNQRTRFPRLQALRERLFKDNQAMLQRGGDVSIRALLTTGIPGTVASPDSVATRKEMLAQKARQDTLQAEQERLRQTQAIALSARTTRQEGKGSVRLTREEYQQMKRRDAEFEDMKCQMAQLMTGGHGRATQQVFQSFRAPSVSHPPPNHPSLEKTLCAYAGDAQSNTLSCTLDEAFYILKADSPDWVWVQRQSNNEQGYLPRQHFMLD